ncbi:hypothetical protein POM88_022944 [Heracleum sosnowskyi]|uniref:Uncharacterized protein n=1 Tax=Heracleum sosnowskyi TaxID=360622 RepID=A0AAD8IG44_9APIA|nr:hypothetical protein POM88_022944 [Heracleum sosnowskyi]
MFLIHRFIKRILCSVAGNGLTTSQGRGKNGVSLPEIARKLLYIKTDLPGDTDVNRRVCKDDVKNYEILAKTHPDETTNFKEKAFHTKLQVENSTQEDILLLHESCSDPVASFIIYSCLGIAEAMNLILGGSNLEYPRILPSLILCGSNLEYPQILPSGFAVLPDRWYLMTNISSFSVFGTNIGDITIWGVKISRKVNG